MARSLRIQYPGAVCHVMARGSHGQEIFADDADRQRFLETLGEACQRAGWCVPAYVLMGNHYHLLVETPEGNLVAGIKWRVECWNCAAKPGARNWTNNGRNCGVAGTLEARVTQAISRMSRRPGRKLEKIKRQLLAIEAEQQPNSGK